MTAPKWPEKSEDHNDYYVGGVGLGPIDYELAAKCLNSHDELVKLCSDLIRILEYGSMYHTVQEAREKLEKLK